MRSTVPAGKSSDENRFNLVGPFVVECVNGSTYLGQYRCWLASDPEKTVKFEGNARELSAYFEAVCSQANPEANAK
jgi:hypothetical protein